MNIRIWNAFASNNSGSYVIVGVFPTVELAGQVARELAEVARDHTVWMNEDDAPQPSPLARYAAGLGIVHHDERFDAWPQYAASDDPYVWAVQHRVFVHSAYTVTMPPALGHAIYARGGRVATEIDHAHHPLVATFEATVPWQARASTDVPAVVQTLVDRLCGAAGPLIARSRPELAPAWRGVVAGEKTGFGEPDLVFGVAFDDLRDGFTEVAAIVAATGLHLGVQLSEAPSFGDALAHLRPCVPAPA